MEQIDLVMVRDNLTAIPRHDLPAGLSYRMFQKGDDKIWAEIETSAGEFASRDLAGRHFRKEFGKLQQELYNRCVYRCDRGDCDLFDCFGERGSQISLGHRRNFHWRIHIDE